jgi:membrane dipeptidase
MHPDDIARQFTLRPSTWERIRAGHELLLQELRPTRAQLHHGLELHYNSFVADAQGSVSTTHPGTLGGDRLAAEAAALEDEQERQDYARRSRTFETAFDPQWLEESRALYAITGVRLGLEDVAHPNENTFRAALEHVTRANFAVQCRDDLRQVGRQADLQAVRGGSQTGLLWHLAGAGCYAEAANPLYNLDLFYALGVRLFQLTYIQDNALCCSWFQERDTGLTDLGRQAVRRLNELGAMVDVAHCGSRSALEIVAASSQPVTFSHCSCRSVYDPGSNDDYLNRVMAQDYAQGIPPPHGHVSVSPSDEVLSAIEAKGGFIGLLTIGYVLARDGQETFANWFAHVEHLLELVGSEHFGVGTDRTYFPAGAPSALDWQNWPYLTVGLVCRGVSDDDIRKIIGGNWVRFVSGALDRQPWGPLL